MVFSGIPFLKRLEKVREAGLSAFEFWGWMDKDIEAIDRKRKELDPKVPHKSLEKSYLVNLEVGQN